MFRHDKQDCPEIPWKRLWILIVRGFGCWEGRRKPFKGNLHTDETWPTDARGQEAPRLELPTGPAEKRSIWILLRPPGRLSILSACKELRRWQVGLACTSSNCCEGNREWQLSARGGLRTAWGYILWNFSGERLAILIRLHFSHTPNAFSPFNSVNLGCKGESC